MAARFSLAGVVGSALPIHRHLQLHVIWYPMIESNNLPDAFGVVMSCNVTIQRILPSEPARGL